MTRLAGFKIIGTILTDEESSRGRNALGKATYSCVSPSRARGRDGRPSVSGKRTSWDSVTGSGTRILGKVACSAGLAFRKPGLRRVGTRLTGRTHTVRGVTALSSLVLSRSADGTYVTKRVFSFLAASCKISLLGTKRTGHANTVVVDGASYGLELFTLRALLALSTVGIGLLRARIVSESAISTCLTYRAHTVVLVGASGRLIETLVTRGTYLALGVLRPLAPCIVV
jgi:hypothetical protein